MTSASLHFTSDAHLDGLRQREFLLNGVPGVLWTPTLATPDSPVPLVLAPQPGALGLERMLPRLKARAAVSASSPTHPMATLTLEMPGAGGRDPLPQVDEARTELRRASLAGEHPSPGTIDQLVLPIVEASVPEWRTALDAAFDLPDIASEAVVSGGLASLAVRLAAVEPQLRAAVIFAGSFIPEFIIEQARAVSIPAHMLLQWDDEGNDRDASLRLFDALGSAQKTLTANLGGHTGTPAHAGDAAQRFLERHLGASAG